MHVISRKKLLKFAEHHPGAKNALENWYRIVKRTRFFSLADLKQTFPSADLVDQFTIFNIGGNKIRLIALIFYRTSKVFVRHVLTHAEYDKEKWKEL